MKLSRSERFARCFYRWATHSKLPLGGFPNWEALVWEKRRDRVFVNYFPLLEDWLDQNFQTTNWGIGNHRPFGQKTAVKGWREREDYIAAQFILHNHDGARFFEVDFDEYNPLYGDVISFLGHTIEVLKHRIPKWLRFTKTKGAIKVSKIEKEFDKRNYSAWNQG